MAGRPWTNHEIQFLKDNFEKMSCEQIAPHINRTRRATQHMFGILGLERPQPQIGDTINRLTILDKYEKKIGKQNKTIAICQCSCDKKLIKHIPLTRIVNGDTQSCGCVLADKARDRMIIMNKSEANSIRTHKLFFKGVGELHKSYEAQLKKGAKIRKLEYNITLDFLWQLFLEQNKKCVLTGMQLELPVRLMKDERTASIDRIDSKIGYIEGNVQWVHKHINAIKQHFSQQYFIDTCRLIVNPIIYNNYIYMSEYFNHNANWKGFGDISLTFWNSVVYGANSRKIDLSIDIEDAWTLFINQNGLCALTGQKISFGLKFGKDSANQTASLDRIDSSRGYELDNIQWIHKDVNRMKQNFTNNEFKHLCGLVTTHQTKKEQEKSCSYKL